MGGGNYSHEAHEALLRTRAGAPQEEVFAQQTCHPLMNPKGVLVRESRDSADHPASLGVVFALDVTGSMGNIPRALASEQLPKFMKVLMDAKIADPQLLFMAVGDATSDRAPLQVGQFESTAKLMDQWLTWSFLEGGGGGTGEESYELALYFLAQHTELDCKVKRNKRGYLFMTGDENPYPMVSRHIVEAVLGDHLDEDLKVEEVVAELQKSYIPFFLIPDKARRARCEGAWRALFGDNVLCLESADDIVYAAAGAILLEEGLAKDLSDVEKTLAGAGAAGPRLKATLHALEPLSEVLSGKHAAWPAGAATPPSPLKKLLNLVKS